MSQPIYENYFYRRVEPEIRLLQGFLAGFLDLFDRSLGLIPVMEYLIRLSEADPNIEDEYKVKAEWMNEEAYRIKDGLLYHHDRAVQFNSYVAKMALTKDYIGTRQLKRVLPPEIIIETVHGYLKGLFWFSQTFRPLMQILRNANDESYLALQSAANIILNNFDVFMGLYESFTIAMELNWNTDDVDQSLLKLIPPAADELPIELAPMVRRRRDFDS